MQNKLKVINDPVYGFINIENELVFDIMEHPLFQRMRRIKQLGLSSYVYPGAMHTRFQHSLGATFLMQNALNVLESKGLELNADERDGALIAILLHDLGHGPFSHTLEHTFFNGVSHETLSEEFMKIINNDMNGKLGIGIDIFENKYHKKILHNLVSSQLDMDRLDYLNRDSFFTGVIEGKIGCDRIIKMLTPCGEMPAIELKGIYSVEKFLIARRLMYWQVYLHKTVVVVEEMLKMIINRARQIIQNGQNLFASPQLLFFLKNDITQDKIYTKFNGKTPLEYFADLDDSDIYTSIKAWKYSDDFVLSTLCKGLLNRNLFKIEISNDEISQVRINELKNQVISQKHIPEQYIDYFVFSGKLYNKAYSLNQNSPINILQKDGTLCNIATASDISNVSTLAKTVVKNFVVSY
ncbi:MAG: HD domain-containing protein [Bacteroidales bacterium]|nr:HD domain-containing protein [Bacteroidales bacterium]